MAEPIEYFAGIEADRAKRAITTYRQGYTGRHYETFARVSPADSFAATDIVAVEMLSVRVPAATAIWLLHDGVDVAADLLRQVPKQAPIWSDAVDLSPAGALWKLWDAIGTDGGLGGRVVRSKLLAAKRPHVVPIYDEHVAAALAAPRTRYWAYWRDQLTGPQGPDLRQAATTAAAAAEASDLSVLRALDIVIWMRHHGWKSARTLLPDFSAPLGSPHG